MAKAKPFRIKTGPALRYILRLTDEGFEADCLDAACCGIGDTQTEAMQSLVENLQALYEFATKSGLKWLVTPIAEEEFQYGRLAAGQKVAPDILGYGVVHHVEVVPTAAGKKLNLPSPAGFEIGHHVSLAA